MRIITRVTLAVLALSLLTAAAGAGSGWLLSRWLRRAPRTPMREVRQAAGYTYINPLLECEIAQPFLGQQELSSFKQKVLDLLDQARQKGRIEEAAVYFRQLNEWPWFGINDEKPFAPASLLKIPLAMAFYRAAERDPTLMDVALRFDGERDLNQLQHFRPAQSLWPGREYRVRELITHLLVNSDNNAANLLMRQHPWDEYRSIFRALVPAHAGGEESRLSVREYSGFLRVLYNASYLTPRDSEELLRFLTQSAFTRGIVAGVPPQVAVASKQGEASLREEDRSIVQLHEFGLVYHPRRPYLLGIMTRGDDFGVLASVLEEVSAFIFREVDRQSQIPRAEG
jgi:beta-lactamase class A